MKFRLIIRIDNCGPEGQAHAPTWKTVIAESQELEEALKCGNYSCAAIVGAELILKHEGKP